MRYFTARPQEIDARLRALSEEWDTDRVLQLNGAGLALASLALGKLIDRRFYLLAGLSAAFLLQHALTGWTPPVQLLQRLGLRTPIEIAAERHALRAVRGDFGATGADPETIARMALEAVGREA